MRYTGPKAKRVRRHGTNLFGSDKYDKILQRKPHGPGKSPRDQEPRRSEYGKQLLEKQKARDIYGLSEKQFVGLYETASKVSGQTGDILKQLLERRLDNVLYRSGMAMTRMQARQFVSHGLFSVNGVRVTSPSFRVKPGMTIAARPRTRTSPGLASVLAAHQKYMPPKWLKVDAGAMKIDVASLPGPDDAERAMDMRQIIEFYSRN